MIAPSPLLTIFGQAILFELLHVVRWYAEPTSGERPRMALSLAEDLLASAADMGIDIEAQHAACASCFMRY